MQEVAGEGQDPPRPDSPVVLDIGGDMGALILYVPPGLAGAEIEISRDGSNEPRTHVAVHERRIGQQHLFAAVYGSLRAGEYTLWREPATPAATVSIAGGEVTELDWR